MKYELPSTELIVIEENNYLKFGEYLNDMQCDDTVNKLSLDNLEYVKKLQKENQQLKEEYNKIQKAYESTFSDYQQLKDNWNKLKEFLKNTRKENLEWDKKHNCEWQGYNAYYELLIKMQELHGSDNNVKD